MPSFDERIAQLTAGLDKEGARTHCGVADTEVEYLLRSRDAVRCSAKPVENRLKGSSDYGFGQFAWCVVRTGTPPLLAGLQDHRTLRDDVRCCSLIDRRIKRRE